MKKLTITLLAFVCVFCCAFALVACDTDTPEKPETVAVESVTLNKATLTLTVGGEESLTATVTPDNATNKAVTWSSDNPSVATVDNGKVKAVAAGTAKITATADGKKAECAVTVNERMPVTEVTAAQWTQIVGGADNYSYKMKMNNQPYQDVNIDGKKTELVMHTQQDVHVIYAKEGEKLYSYMEAEDGWKRVEITGDTIGQAELQIDGMNIIKACKDDYGSFTYADGKYAAAEIDKTQDETIGYKLKNVVVKFSDGKLVEVSLEIPVADDSTLKVAVDSFGTTTVTLPANYTEIGDDDDPNKVDEAQWQYALEKLVQQNNFRLTLTANDEVVGMVELDGDLYHEDLDGESIYVNGGGNFYRYSKNDAAWTRTEITDQAYYAAVQSGPLYLVTEGTHALLEVFSSFEYSDGKYFAQSINVYDGVVLKNVSVKFVNGAIEEIVCIMVGDGGDEPDTTVTIDRIGSTVVDEPTEYDEDKIIEVEYIEILEIEIYIEVGEEYTLTLIILPENATNRTVTWSSSDTDIATVDNNGKITALREGRTIVVATTSNGITANRLVCVVPPHEHNLQRVEAEEADCFNEGKIEHYKCYECGRLYADADGEIEIKDHDSVVIPGGHKMYLVAAKEATCTSKGHIGYYECSVCKVWYKNADCTGFIEHDPNNVEAAKKEHSYVNDVCSVCTTRKPTEGLVYAKRFTYDSNYREQYYAVLVGRGTATASDIVIADEYDGAPVTQIGYEAFAYDENVTSVYIPYSVTIIDSNAFRNTGAISVTIPAGIKEIRFDAFSRCSNLTSIYYEGDIAGWCNIDFSLNYGGKQIYSTDLYIDDELVTDVVLPETATTIKQYVFYGNKAITSVTTGNGVTEIGECAFGYATNLTDVVIGDKVATISRNAFVACEKLTNITLGGSIAQIEKMAFNGVPLQNITYNGAIDAWVTIEGLSEIMHDEPDDRKLIIDGNEIVGDLVIPDSVTTISDYAFYACSGLTSLTIPESVTEIGESVFGKCVELSSLALGNNVESIGESAFEGCTSLTSVIIPDSVIEIGESAFTGCASLNDLTIGDNVTTIGWYAFDNCTSLTSVTIPDSVTGILGAFNGCTGLTSVTIGSGIEEIGYRGFYKCENLLNVTIPGNVKKIANGAFYGCERLSSVTLCDGVETIWQEAFDAYHGALAEVVIPVSLTSIGNSVFNSEEKTVEVFYKGTAEEWKEISFGQYNKAIGAIYYYSESAPEVSGNFWHYDGDKIVAWPTYGLVYTIDGDHAVVSSLGEVETSAIVFAAEYEGLPVTHIANNLFFDNVSIYSVTVPDSVTTIGEYAFYCQNLYIVKLGNSVEIIGEHALYWSNIRKIVIPDSVTLIDEYAFDRCELREIIIGSGVKNIYTSFGNKSNAKCYYKGTAEEWEAVQMDGKEYLTSILYYYSETEPTEEGNYWHYAIDGKTPLAW